MIAPVERAAEIIDRHEWSRLGGTLGEQIAEDLADANLLAVPVDGGLGCRRGAEKRNIMNYLIEIARGLRSEDGENPEYDRALVELICHAYGLESDSSRAHIAETIGIPEGSR